LFHFKGHKANYTKYVDLSVDAIKAHVANIDVFMANLDDQVDGKRFFIGDELTVVDCLMCWHPASLYMVISFPVEYKYPNLWRYYQALRETPPAGAEEYLNGGFPFFCKIIFMLNCSRCWGGKSWVGNTMYWAEDMPSRCCCCC